MISSSFTLGALVDEALNSVYRTAERPFPVVLADPESATDTTVRLATAEQWDRVNPTDVIEIGSELMLVTGKTTDPTPVFTVMRGYTGTTPATYDAGAVGVLNPAFPRARVASAVRRALPRMDVFIPFVTSAEYTVTPTEAVIDLPADTMRVFEVGAFAGTGNYMELDGWKFLDDMPTSVIPSGKTLELPRYVFTRFPKVVVKRQSPYVFTGTGESATVTLPQGVDTLVTLYAAAFVVSRREIGRLEVDSSDEWNKAEVAQSGVNLGMVRDLWSQFYRELDEVRRLSPAPKHRPFRKMRRFI